MRAMTMLAYLYREGEGVKKDMAAAFQWAKRAADLDDAKCLTMVAVCHLFGKGTTMDEQSGLVEIGQAAALGSEHACMVLANAYHLGRHGLKKDSAKVAYWAAKMRRAADNGIHSTGEENRARIAEIVAALP